MGAAGIVKMPAPGAVVTVTPKPGFDTLSRQPAVAPVKWSCHIIPPDGYRSLSLTAAAPLVMTTWMYWLHPFVMLGRRMACVSDGFVLASEPSSVSSRPQYTRAVTCVLARTRTHTLVLASVSRIGVTVNDGPSAA